MGFLFIEDKPLRTKKILPYPNLLLFWVRLTCKDPHLEKAQYISNQKTKRIGENTSEFDSMIEGCLANERQWQEVLYKRFQPKMMGLCMRYYNDRSKALEQLNLAFLKVFKNLNKYQGDGSFEGWIYKIVQRTVLDDLRKEVKRQKKLKPIDELPEVENTEISALKTLYEKDLLNLLKKLSPMSRLVFNLHTIEGFTHKEIGKELNISDGTSKWHLSEAKRKLKTLIKKYYEIR